MSESSSRGGKRKGSNKSGSSSKKSKSSDSDTGALELPPVCFLRVDCAPQLTIGRDFLTVTGDKGYRLARANHGVADVGCRWYWELLVVSCGSGNGKNSQGHARVGWASKQAALQAPLGYDQWGYAYRDLEGSRVHNSLRHNHYGEPFGCGDVVGCMLLLNNSKAAATTGTNGTLSEDNTAAHSKKSADEQIVSEIRFFLNGEDQGIAFTDVPHDTYYPAVSLYGSAQVRVNFGPSFIYPPSSFEKQSQSQHQHQTKHRSIVDASNIALEQKQVQQLWVMQQRADKGIISVQKLDKFIAKQQASKTKVKVHSLRSDSKDQQMSPPRDH